MAYSFFWSGCWELNPGHILPEDAYYHCTTARLIYGIKQLKFYTLAILFMHLAQARTLLPASFPRNKRAHCRLGCFLTLDVGLYFPLSFTRVPPIEDFFWQIEQIFSMLCFATTDFHGFRPRADNGFSRITDFVSAILDLLLNKIRSEN